jgi:hypothetical protein
VAGQASGGQTLTPNPNVNAPAGYGGDTWGANGGGITPYTGSDTITGTQSRAATATNLQTPKFSLGEQVNRDALSAATLDSSITGGSNQG